MNKIFDYMAAGRPTVIAADVPGNPVSESGGGVVVPPESPEALADGIEELMRLSPAVRLEMGKRARTYVAEHHSYRKLAGRLAEVLDEVLQAETAFGKAN